MTMRSESRMPPALVVTGTDTGIGKTIFSAGLVQFLDGAYWKPVQAGLDEETDSGTVRRLTGLPANRILPEAWRLTMPASPHLSAERDGVRIDTQALAQLPFAPAGTRGPLIVEGAGGAMVPLTRETLFIDLFAVWRAPVVLCARTTLGTLNHTLLAIEALRRREIPVVGVALIGHPHEDNPRVIAEMGRVRLLGRLPWLDPLTPRSLADAFASSFRRDDFLVDAPPAATSPDAASPRS
jgi:dethiobiotin synthetase